MDACVQCRGCETACPSGVPFGQLMEGTPRDARGRNTAPRRDGGAWATACSATTVSCSRARRSGDRATAPPGAEAPRSASPRRCGGASSCASGTDVWLFTGCVMDAWQRDTHMAVMRLMEATGSGVALAGSGGACCGALHLHAGLGAQAASLAERVMASMPGEQEIVVDSAGCGAALKDYGHLLGTAEANAFSARVLRCARVAGDASRSTAAGDALEHRRCHPGPLPSAPRPARAWCRAHRACLRYVNIVELDDEGLCCGAGGAYATLHPETATLIRDRKVAAVERSGAGIVASANPGCVMHLAAAGLTVRHPMRHRGRRGRREPARGLSHGR